MLIDSKLLRDRESQNYDYWVVYKVLLDDVVEAKKHKSKKNFSKSDVESIFSMIEDED